MNVPGPNTNNQSEVSEVQANLEKAQERIAVLESQLKDTHEKQEIELQNAKIKIEKLECERALWEEEKSLLSRVNELEKELHAARETIGMMQESIKEILLIDEEQMSNITQRLKHTIDALQRENKTHYEKRKTIANEVTILSEKFNILGTRLQQKELLVSPERDSSYRQQLDLYEKEMTPADSNSISNDRIPALERTLESSRDLVSKLEANSTASDAITSREEYQKLRDENEKLKAELEHRILKGDFNCNARILHVKMNPAAIASQQNEADGRLAMQQPKKIENPRVAQLSAGENLVSSDSTDNFTSEDDANEDPDWDHGSLIKRTRVCKPKNTAYVATERASVEEIKCSCRYKCAYVCLCRKNAKICGEHCKCNPQICTNRPVC